MKATIFIAFLAAVCTAVPLAQKPTCWINSSGQKECDPGGKRSIERESSIGFEFE
ncbi:uncharacterized protein MYCFIDRAFT_210910 [Pseudocercospora fijiensis CIRAD86]|uniref:Uncharacterized protein n=1 Tax=Pseudocercospora fijiensis (strain CIRAD86) TaxID=383855 RepID=M2Z406_PSEFD|nr:uncharacterized protein MYCFIDRAFT_210910 [Pseudocercospora fijiensis CIRAD86]EME84555.1 hypothetical protein MYCFIDRAFT_210910 [Pseudocercospora fijiensis CIRAD86]